MSFMSLYAVKLFHSLGFLTRGRLLAEKLGVLGGGRYFSDSPESKIGLPDLELDSKGFKDGMSWARTLDSKFKRICQVEKFKRMILA